jgi:hypothetical protein
VMKAPTARIVEVARTIASDPVLSRVHVGSEAGSSAEPSGIDGGRLLREHCCPTPRLEIPGQVRYVCDNYVYQTRTRSVGNRKAAQQ